jgi:hypothetical protein
MQFRSFLLFLLIPFSFISQQKKKVLFIGNSYIFSNNLPQLIADLALSKQDTVLYDQSVFGGYTYSNHCSNMQTWQKIRSNNWDVVVLQAQSQEPSLSPSQVLQSTYPYARQLHDSVRAIHPCAEVMFFMTWGRKNGDSFNCGNYPPVCTYIGMQARLRESYMMFKDSLSATCAPVGVAWKKHVELFPSLDLYQPDESHPSIHGSYLAACVFYSSVFKNSCLGGVYPSSITSSEAINIQTIALTTVLDSVAVWNLGSNKPKADFTYTLLNNSTFQFANASKNALSYWWSFGSVNVNPIYQFQGNPPYSVQLKAVNACTADSVLKIVVASGIDEHGSSKLKRSIYRSANKIYAVTGEEFSGCKAQITDLSGHQIWQCSLQESKGIIDLSELNQGLYFISVFENGIISATEKIILR